MKKIVLLFLSFFILFSCNNIKSEDKSNDIISNGIGTGGMAGGESGIGGR